MFSLMKALLNPINMYILRDSAGSALATEEQASFHPLSNITEVVYICRVSHMSSVLCLVSDQLTVVYFAITTISHSSVTHF